MGFHLLHIIILRARARRMKMYLGIKTFRAHMPVPEGFTPSVQSLYLCKSHSLFYFNYLSKKLRNLSIRILCSYKYRNIRDFMRIQTSKFVYNMFKIEMLKPLNFSARPGPQLIFPARPVTQFFISCFTQCFILGPFGLAKIF